MLVARGAALRSGLRASRGVVRGQRGVIRVAATMEGAAKPVLTFATGNQNKLKEVRERAIAKRAGAARSQDARGVRSMLTLVFRSRPSWPGMRTFRMSCRR